METRPPIEIDLVAVKDLHRFACEVYEDDRPDSVNPLAKHVALAQTENPAADPDQVGLVVVRRGSRIVGHASFVPGRVRNRGEMHRVVYASAIYLEPDSRHAGAINEVLAGMASGGLPPDIVGCTMSPDAQRMVDHIGGTKIGPRIDPTIEVQRLRRLGRARYPQIKHRFYRYAVDAVAQLPPGVIVEETDAIPDDAFDGIEEDEPTAFHRDAEVINWGLRYPWVLSESETTDRYPNAYFEMVRPHYRIFAVAVRDATHDHRGHVVLSTSTSSWSDSSRTTVRVLDHRIAGPRAEADAIVEHVGLHAGQRYGADRIEFPAELTCRLRRRRGLRRLVGTQENAYAFVPMSADSPVRSFIEDVQLHTCDGDFWHA